MSEPPGLSCLFTLLSAYPRCSRLLLCSKGHQVALCLKPTAPVLISSQPRMQCHTKCVLGSAAEIQAEHIHMLIAFPSLKYSLLFLSMFPSGGIAENFLAVRAPSATTTKFRVYPPSSSTGQSVHHLLLLFRSSAIYFLIPAKTVCPTTVDN